MKKLVRGGQKLTSVVLKVLVVVTVAVGLTQLPVLDNSTSQAADLSLFDAGNIISDSQFFNGSGLTAANIQSFLDSKVPTCTINNGQASHAAGAAWGTTTIASTCLKNYSQTTPTMAAQTGLCTAYSGASNETAAQIIAKISQACSINPKVLIVLLEKEQSLVTDTWPTVRQFSQATGFACYDNGQPCIQLVKSQTSSIRRTCLSAARRQLPSKIEQLPPFTTTPLTHLTKLP